MVLFKYSSVMVAAAMLATANAVEVPAAYTTLHALVEKAGLAGEQEDYTLFAPEDAAFGKLDETVVNGLQYDYNVDILASVLKDHVVGAKVVAAQVTAADITATSLNNNEFTYKTTLDIEYMGESKAKINAADVVDSDTPNYAVHGIDTVLTVSSNIPTLNTLADVATANGLTTLVQLVTDKTELLGEISVANDTPETVFAPSEAAFAAFVAKYPNLTDEQLKKVLEYHVTGAIIQASDATEAGVEIDTLISEKLTAKKVGDSVMINDAKVVASVRAWGGVAHVIDQVLLPPSLQQSVVDIAVTSELDTLVALVTKAELAETLSTIEKVTVFAPSEQAFADLGDIAASVQQEHNADVLATILKYHVAGDALETLPASISTLAEQAITFADSKLTTTSGQEVAVAASVTTPADALQQGVVFPIDTVLLPTGIPVESIKDIAARTDALSSLVAALSKVNLVDRFGDLTDTPVTVFAPTNEAFAAFLGDTDLADLDDDFLTEVLTYHVVAGAVDSTGLTEELTTLEGSKIMVDLTEGTLNDGVKIVTKDVRALNGYVHVVDTVLKRPAVENGASTATQAITGMFLAVVAALNLA